MSGSRLGRGRGGRLAVYGGCGVVIILLVFLYRAATSEMARLRELHIQCVHQHESLAAQLQVIFEYKVRLEKSLAEEKSSNAMVKQELQQRASREKSLRDKDSIEAMQRFKSLQQTYKILETEHQDLQEECKKRESQALEERNKLESTHKDLIKQTNENKDKIISEKEKTLENFKNKYFELETLKNRLAMQYNDLIKNNDNTDSTIEHMRKEIFQLRAKLDETKDEQDDTLPNQEQSNVRFAPEDDNIIPVGPNEVKEEDQQKILPLPYNLREKKRNKKDETFPSAEDVADIDELEKKNNKDVDGGAQDSQKQVLAPPKISSSKDPNELENKIQDEKSTNGDTLARPDAQNNFADFRDIDNEIILIPNDDILQAIISSSSMKTISSLKLETTTKSNTNIDSVSSNKVFKTSSKVKIPPGVLPILMIMDQNVVEKIDKEKTNDKKQAKKNDENGQNIITLKKKNIVPEVNSKEKENEIDKDNDNDNDNDNNIDSPYKVLSANKYGDDQNAAARRQNGNWFKVKPGVQEFGEEPNPIDRLAGLENIVGRQFDTGDEQYVGADFEPQAQKVDDLRLAEGEEEEEVGLTLGYIWYIDSTNNISFTLLALVFEI
ncbi:hypothetical protein M0804_008244 [Polistes exclamans]|nr:hypothetical protein M0804_008244 [Polistes exclamans]